MAWDRNGLGPEWLRTDMSWDRNGLGTKWLGTEMPQNQNVSQPKRRYRNDGAKHPASTKLTTPSMHETSSRHFYT